MSRGMYGELPMELRRRAGCRRWILRFQPEAGIFSLTVPEGSSSAEIKSFLDAHRSWMAERQREAPWRPAYAPGERHLLWGRYEPLGGGRLPVGQRALAEFRAMELQRVVEPLLMHWSAVMGVAVKQLVVQDMRSQWGSCVPARGRIALNLRLTMLPPEYTEYVLIHELNHLLHPDHSPAFYQEMDRLCPAWETLRKQIKTQPLQPLPPD